MEKSLIKSMCCPNDSWKNTNMTVGKVMFSNEDYVRMGQPVIMPEGGDNSDSRDDNAPFTIVVGVLFPTVPGASVKQTFMVNGNNIRPMDPKNIFSKRRTKVIDKFDFNRIDRICGYLSENGGLDLVMEDIPAMTNFIVNIGKIKKYLPHSVFFSRQRNDRQPPKNDDQLSMCLSMHSLEYVLPIIDSRDSKGMALTIVLFWKKAWQRDSRFYPTEETCLAFSRSKKNLIYGDGEELNQPGFLNNTHAQDIIDRLGYEKNRQAKYKSSEKDTKKASTVLSKDVLLNESPISVMQQQVFEWKTEPNMLTSSSTQPTATTIKYINHS